jgi:hypothetical protein
MLEGSYAGKVSYMLSWDFTHWSAPVDVGIQLWHTGDVPGWNMNNYPTFFDSQHLQNVDSPNASSSAVTGQFPIVTYVETATTRVFAKRAVARQVYFSK